METNSIPRRCLGLAFLLASISGAICRAAEPGAPVGYLRVDRPAVEVVVPNRDYVFKVGNSARLFQLEGNCLIVQHTIEGVIENLYAVRWNKYDAPAWISNERLVMFGKLTPTIEGALKLEQGERLPVAAVGGESYHAAVVRFGVTGVVNIAKGLPGLVFEEATDTASPVAKAAVTSAPRARVTITGAGSVLAIVTNDPSGAPALPTSMVAAPPPVSVPAVPVVEVPPAVPPPPTSTGAPPSETSPLQANVKWPSLLEDRGNLLVIAVVLLLSLILVRVATSRRRASARKAVVAAATQPPAPSPAPSSAPKLKMAAPAGGDTAGRLRYVPSNVNQTIILNQQHVAAQTVAPIPAPAQPRPKPQGASATAIIPSPPVLPDRRTGGVLWIGKYAVEQLLGRGRMGVVYKAHQQDLNRSVALKLLAEGGYASEKQRERFVREAQAIARLRHPNIVTVFEVGEWEGQPYFAMEFIDGRSLDKMVVKQRLAPLDAARLAHKVAQAIDYAHSCGIVHRDLKPGNIIIDGKGDPIITDFGLARHVDDDPAAAGDDILGTPAYMSPEQARGRANEADSRSDVYSTGAILYAMLTGHDPFIGTSLLDTLQKVIHERPVPPEKVEPEVDVAISAICMKAMAKDPKKRYQTAGEMAEDLARYIKVLESGQTPSTGGRSGWLGRLFGRDG